MSLGKIPERHAISREQVLARLRSALSSDAARAIDAVGGVDQIADTMTRLATETAQRVLFARKEEAIPEEVAQARDEYRRRCADLERERAGLESRKRDMEQEHRDAMQMVTDADPRFLQALTASEEIREAAEVGNQQLVRSLGVVWGAYFGLQSIGSKEQQGARVGLAEAVEGRS